MWHVANPARAYQYQRVPTMSTLGSRPLDAQSKYLEEQVMNMANMSGITSKASSEAGDREVGGSKEEEPDENANDTNVDDILDYPEDFPLDFPEDCPSMEEIVPSMEEFVAVANNIINGSVVGDDNHGKGSATSAKSKGSRFSNKNIKGDIPAACPSMKEIVADANNSINVSVVGDNDNHSKASATSARSKRSGKSNHNKGGSFDKDTLDNMSVFSYTSSHSGGGYIDANKSVRSTRSVKSNKSTRSVKSNRSVGSSDDANKSVRSVRSTNSARSGQSGRSGGTNKSNKSNLMSEMQLSADQATDAYQKICGTTSGEGAQQGADTAQEDVGVTSSTTRTTYTAQEDVVTASTTTSLSSRTSKKKKKRTQTSAFANIQQWGPSISESFADTDSLYSDAQTVRCKKKAVAMNKRMEDENMTMEAGEEEIVRRGLERTEAVQKRMEGKRIMYALTEEDEEEGKNTDNGKTSDKVGEDDSLEAAYVYVEYEAREETSESAPSAGDDVANKEPNETEKQEDANMALDKEMNTLENDMLPDIPEATATTSTSDPFVLDVQEEEARISDTKDAASISSISRKNGTASSLSSNSHSSRVTFSFAKLKPKRFFGKKKTANNESLYEQGMDKLVSLVRVIENMEDEEDRDIGNVDTEEVELSYNRSDVDDPSLPSANNVSIGKGMKSKGTSRSDTKKVSTFPMKDAIMENRIPRVESTKSNNTDGTDNVTVESSQGEMKEEVDDLWDDDDAPLNIEFVDGERARIGYYGNNVPKTMTCPKEEGVEEAGAMGGLFERIFACGAPPFQCNFNNNYVTCNESTTKGESSTVLLYEDEVDEAFGIEIFQEGNMVTRIDYFEPVPEVEEDMQKVTSKIILRTHVTPGFEVLSSNDGQGQDTIVDSVTVKIDDIAHKLERKRGKQRQEKKRENQAEMSEKRSGGGSSLSSSIKSKKNGIHMKLLKKLKEKKSRKQMKKISKEVEDNAPAVVATKR